MHRLRHLAATTATLAVLASAGLAHAGGVIVPMYVYPGDGNGRLSWDRLIQQCKPATQQGMPASQAATSIYIIANPDNGPPLAALDANYKAVIEQALAAGCKVLGYVRTGTGTYGAGVVTNGARPNAEITADIDRWYALEIDHDSSIEGETISGIFFDEVANLDPSAADAANEAILTKNHSIGRHVKSKSGDKIVVLNPGTFGFFGPAGALKTLHSLPASGGADGVDVVVSWENNKPYGDGGNALRASDAQRAAQASNPDEWAILLHGTSHDFDEVRPQIDLAIKDNFGWANAKACHNWNSFPDPLFWAALVGRVDQAAAIRQAADGAAVPPQPRQRRGRPDRWPPETALLRLQNNLHNWYLPGRDQPILWGTQEQPYAWADFDGDGIDEIAVYNKGTWLITLKNLGWSEATAGSQEEVDQKYRVVTFGAASDLPVPGDYDGDGAVDLAVFVPDTREWKIRQSSNQQDVTYQYGNAGQIPVPGDYNGDGTTQLAMYTPANSPQVTGEFGIALENKSWSDLAVSGAYTRFYIGTVGSQPVPGDYNGDGKDDFAVLRAGDGGASTIWFTNDFQSFVPDYALPIGVLQGHAGRPAQRASSTSSQLAIPIRGRFTHRCS